MAAAKKSSTKKAQNARNKLAASREKRVNKYATPKGAQRANKAGRKAAKSTTTKLPNGKTVAKSGTQKAFKSPNAMKKAEMKAQKRGEKAVAKVKAAIAKFGASSKQADKARDAYARSQRLTADH